MIPTLHRFMYGLHKNYTKSCELKFGTNFRGHVRNKRSFRGQKCTPFSKNIQKTTRLLNSLFHHYFSIFQKSILPTVRFVRKSCGLIHHYTSVLHCFIDTKTKKMKLHQILFILSQFIFSCNFYYFLFWIMQRNNKNYS